MRWYENRRALGGCEQEMLTGERGCREKPAKNKGEGRCSAVVSAMSGAMLEPGRG